LIFEFFVIYLNPKQNNFLVQKLELDKGARVQVQNEEYTLEEVDDVGISGVWIARHVRIPSQKR